MSSEIMNSPQGSDVPAGETSWKAAETSINPEKYRSEIRADYEIAQTILGNNPEEVDPSKLTPEQRESAATALNRISKRLLYEGQWRK